MNRRVVITGIGCVTPLGADVERVWDQLVEGRSGIGPLTLFDASNFPVQIAGEVHDWDISAAGEDPRLWEDQPRQTAFAVGAAVDAVRGSGLEDAGVDPLRVGVYLGCGETFPELKEIGSLVGDALEGERLNLEKFIRSAQQVCRPEMEWVYDPCTAASCVAGRFNAQGPNLNCIAACASSAQSVGEAAQIIRRGEADVMITGGAHSMIHPLGMTGFLRLAALSLHNDEPTKAIRPFDRYRDGFVVGEGAAILVLEELQHARRRGAEIWAELTGYASTQDAFRITDAHPEGRGATTCIRQALADARLTPEQIDYINAHGTGTVVNDRVETLAVKRAFGRQAYKVPISSVKSMIGHFTTGSAAFELIVSVMAIRNGVIPPTINYETPDPECDLDYVANTARQLECRHVLSNSFGFGGQNAVLIASRVNNHVGR